MHEAVFKWLNWDSQKNQVDFWPGRAGSQGSLGAGQPGCTGRVSCACVTHSMGQGVRRWGLTARRMDAELIKLDDNIDQKLYNQYGNRGTN